MFGADVAAVTVSIDGSDPKPMMKDADAPGVWLADLRDAGEGNHDLRAEASTAAGARHSDTIEIVVASAQAERPPAKARLGHDVHTVGPWPEHGVLGSQLGPNKNGKKW